LYRDINLFVNDVRSGKISWQEAKDVYGVVVKTGGIVTDFVETGNLAEIALDTFSICDFRP
jgi:hypothetical protein